MGLIIFMLLHTRKSDNILNIFLRNKGFENQEFLFEVIRTGVYLLQKYFLLIFRLIALLILHYSKYVK